MNNLVSNLTRKSSSNAYNSLRNAMKNPQTLSHGGDHKTEISRQSLYNENAEIAHTSFKGLDTTDTVTLSSGGKYSDGGMQDPTYFEAISKLKNGSIKHCRAHNPEGIDFFNDLQCTIHQGK